MKRYLLGVAVVSGLVCGPCAASVTLLGRAEFPLTASDFSGLSDKVAGVPHNRLGGIGSGIAYSGRDDVYFCIADRGPQDGAANYFCRFQTVRIVLTPGVHIDLVGTTMLTFSDGSPLVGLASDSSGGTVSGTTTPRRFDPEGIVPSPGGGLLICEEYGPRVCEFSMDGGLMRVWSPPAGYEIAVPSGDPSAERKGQRSGRFPNQGFEGLTITPDGMVYAVMQGALIQDSGGGERLGPDDRNLRVVAFESASGHVKAEYVYRVEQPPPGAKRPYGVSEILALNDTDFLFLERDGSEKKFRRVYRASINGATPIGTGAAKDATPMVKESTPFIDFLDPSFGLAGDMPQKIEGLTFGPPLPDGRRTLIVASDNDFAEGPTHFWVFAFMEADLPGLHPR